jgi:hypothetical protein
MLQQAYTPSNTGIASFVHASEDYDLAPIGIGSMKEQADRLAEFGRHGDIYVVHAAEGETVIPMEVLDSIPQVKEMLFSHMRDMGIDPGRYVVGNKLNSINPDTGMPEFFFKKIWKGVKKVFKVVAPILLPIIGNMILPGIGGILASMAYTKLSGGSWADTLKAGVLSYAGGALMSGLGGAATGISGTLDSALGAVGLGGSTTFLGGLTKGLTEPLTALVSPGAAFAKGIFGSPGAASAAAGISDGFDINQPDAAVALRPTAGHFGGMDAANPGAGGTPAAKPEFFARQLADIAPETGKSIDSGMSTAGDYLFRAGDNREQVLAAEKAAGVAYQQRPPGLQTAAGFDAEVAKAGPSIYAKYGPSLALAGGAALAGGVFDAPEDPDAEARREAERRFGEASAPNALFEGDPDSYVINNLNPYQFSPAPNYRGTEPVEFARAAAPPPIYQGIPPVDLARATAPPMRLQNNARYYAAPPLQNNPVYARYNAAGGGFIDGQPQYLNYGGMAQYPRREMLVEGPGTERSDDIPAMLSDGEFVLNSRSVRGADPTGQGNRYRGAQNLYNMMRNFEMKG